MLPKGADGTVSTLRHRWRAGAYLEVEARPRGLLIPLNLKEMLGAAVAEFREYIEDLDINPYKPISFKAVYDAIGQVKVWHNQRWVKWLILAAAATIIIGGCALFAYWYLMRRTQANMFSQASGVSAILDRSRTNNPRRGEQNPERENPPAPIILQQQKLSVRLRLADIPQNHLHP